MQAGEDDQLIPVAILDRNEDGVPNLDEALTPPETPEEEPVPEDEATGGGVAPPVPGPEEPSTTPTDRPSAPTL